MAGLSGIKCPNCNNKLRHMHDCAYGIPGAHLSDTERFECECGFSCWNPIDGVKLGLVFMFDVSNNNEKGS